MHRALWVSLSVALTGCGEPAAPAAPSQQIETRNTDNELIVAAFAEAYNNGDLDGMMDHAHDAFSWRSIENDKAETIVSNADALRNELSSYFNADQKPRSDVVVVKSHGDYVTTLERAYWTVDGAERSQASFAVYQIEDGRIRRVWYFPAQP